MNQEKIKFAFFGTPKFSTIILDKLKAKNFLPSLIITAEDKPKGRNLLLVPPEAKIWAENNRTLFLQPRTLKSPETYKEIKSHGPFDFFVVASYGKILPQEILDIPKLGTLNVHPSLLPKLRGASPVRSAILTEFETGVTIIQLDSQMDHGSIVAQEKNLSWNTPNSIPYAGELEDLLAHEGGKLLVEILSKWLEGKIKEKEQNHNLATFTKKIEKSDGELNLDETPENNLRKIRAFQGWPTAYFFLDRPSSNLGGVGSKTRIIVKQAHIEEGKLVIDRIIPEGKKEMSYKDFLNGLK